MAKRSGTVLVVDDDRDVLTAARLLLKRHFERVETLENPERLPERLGSSRYDVLLLDMNFSGGRSSGREGLGWLARVRELDPDAVVILMTAYGDAELAVEAIRRGATDFVLKPWQNEKLVATVSAAADLNASRREVARLKERQAELAGGDAPAMIAESPAMREVLRLIGKAAPTDANVLILGENGTGKEVVARELWRRSQRVGEVFLGVDLGSLPEGLFESELFGHVKGAFTDAVRDRMGRFQAAEGGTLFLDEIGNLPPHLQVKLLRALERREVMPVGSDRIVPVDVRLICATNRDLDEATASGQFRTDLLYRINTVQIEVPPLRARREDIGVLARHFLARHAQKYGVPARGLHPSALRQLEAYHWPGNVRELEHAIERAMILSDSDPLQSDDFALAVRGRSDGGSSLTFESLALDDVEREVVRFVLDRYAGNVSQTARELGITRTSLYRRIEKYGL